MTEETARWRSSVCILLLFFIVAFFIEGRELVIFTRTFIEVHTTWLPVQGLVQESLIATSERRSSSTRSSAVAHIMLFTVEAKVRYTLNDKTYGVTASGWGEYFRRLSEWEQSGVEAGRSISIRVRPDALDHATLLGDWTRIHCGVRTLHRSGDSVVVRHRHLRKIRYSTLCLVGVAPEVAQYC